MKKLVPDDAVLIPENAERVFKGRIFDVYQWEQKMFDGTSATFEMIRRPDTVCSIPIVDNKILVIDDEQPHTGSRIGFPGGRVDSQDESTLTSAKREVLEETGYEFNDWKLTGVFQPHTKLEWFIYFYIASNGHKVGKPHLDTGEKITLKQLSFDEVKNLAITKSGYLADSKDLFEGLNSLDELINLPKFSGKSIER